MKLIDYFAGQIASSINASDLPYWDGSDMERFAEKAYLAASIMVKKSQETEEIERPK